MKKKIGVIVALSIMITGINYPTYSVYAQEENQDIFQSEENSAESDLQQENGEQTLNEGTGRFERKQLALSRRRID